MIRILPVPAIVDTVLPVGTGRRRRGYACMFLRENGQVVPDERIPALRKWRLAAAVQPNLRCASSGLLPVVSMVQDVCLSSWCRECPMAEGSLANTEPGHVGKVA